jgi:hypothetical protein
MSNPIKSPIGEAVHALQGDNCARQGLTAISGKRRLKGILNDKSVHEFVCDWAPCQAVAAPIPYENEFDMPSNHIEPKTGTALT